MAEIRFTVSARLAWWVRWYLSGCALFARLHGVQPHSEKIGRFVARHGVKWRLEIDDGQ